MSNAKPFVPSDSNIAFANETVQQLDLLVADRKNWESTIYKKSNENLYELMAKCKKIFEDKFENATSDNDRKAIRLEIAHRLTADGIKVQKNSTTLTMFVRYVFKAELHELSPLASLDMPIVNNRTPYVVLVAKPMTNGKTHIVALLKNASETLVNVLYKHIAKGDLDAQEEQEFLDKEMAGLKAKPAANDTSVSEKPIAA